MPDDGRPALRLNRQELSGAFGDIGTDLPLLIGMILAAGLPAAGVFVAFGLMQWLTAWRYGIPMAVQPLKAVAVLVIAQRPPVETIWGAGVAIGLVMLLLTVTGTLDRIARLVPKAVVRGLQLGLGIQLAWIASATTYRQRARQASRWPPWLPGSSYCCAARPVFPRRCSSSPLASHGRSPSGST